jgi:hypothetical protein
MKDRSKQKQRYVRLEPWLDDQLQKLADRLSLHPNAVVKMILAEEVPGRLRNTFVPLGEPVTP